MFLKLISSWAFINSILDIRAIVLLIPSCLANAHIVMFTDSSAVTAIKRSESSTLASFISDNDIASP